MHSLGILIALIVGLELYEKYNEPTTNTDSTEVVESTE